MQNLKEQKRDEKLLSRKEKKSFKNFELLPAYA